MSQAIAVHTFITVWCKKGARARVLAALVVLAVCAYTTLYVGIGLAKNKDAERPYDAPSPVSLRRPRDDRCAPRG